MIAKDQTGTPKLEAEEIKLAFKLPLQEQGVSM